MVVKIQVDGEALTNLFKEQIQSIAQLIGTKKIESLDVVNGNTEEGYAISPVNSEVNVLLLVKGRVDLSSHLAKTEEKLIKSKEKLSRLQVQMNADGYAAKVDSEVKEADEERLRNLTSEVETLDAFVASLQRLTFQ